MNWIAEALITAIIAFIATNVDDILILTLFFSQVNRSFRKRHIVAGQYLGISALMLISLLGFLLGRVAPPEWIGLLGLIPIAIGINLFWHRADPAPDAVGNLESGTGKASVPPGLFSRQTFSVAAVIIANGGDNVGIYMPLFASSDTAQMLILWSVFLVLTGVWCYTGWRLARQPVVAQTLSRYGHVFVPFVLVALGLIIMAKSGTFGLFR